MADMVSREVAEEQKDAQAAARKALLEQIASAAAGTKASGQLRSLAEAYALVVAPERSTVSASAEARS